MRDLQFDTAMKDVALFTRRGGHQKHPWPVLSTKIKVGNGFIRFNKEATRRLGVWMDIHLTFKEHHNWCMKKARAAEAQLRILMRMHDLILERVRVVLIACVQAVALHGSELCWDPKQTGRREDLLLRSIEYE